MTGHPILSVSVAGVTLDRDGRVLVIRRRDNDQWQAPGGVLEADETFEQGVVREVLEETNVQVEVEQLTGVYKNLQKNVVALVYRCRYLSGTPTPSDEAAEVLWTDPAEIIKQMAPAFAVRIEDALRLADGPPASRAHDGVAVYGS
ncbi:NUDIX hydrolase [Actinomycetospora straminea]|uniref:NUDIX domain-containing protein n=1 Tax=Actinomycetospora straminea TaxID=663607 RepID=A0ABP9EFZ4_9PSEU|nr:NUDIX domain-containing protein [Actinomycetospora straminea]MDD7934346.1 NUDIX domain-containing protein [Actinomycetospora straminea]